MAEPPTTLRPGSLVQGGAQQGLEAQPCLISVTGDWEVAWGPQVDKKNAKPGLQVD